VLGLIFAVDGEDMHYTFSERVYARTRSVGNKAVENLQQNLPGNAGLTLKA
jgi:hypothetical protein